MNNIQKILKCIEKSYSSKETIIRLFDLEIHVSIKNLESIVNKHNISIVHFKYENSRKYISPVWNIPNFKDTVLSALSYVSVKNYIQNKYGLNVSVNAIKKE